MSWSTPKTDWYAPDSVAYTDMNRIESNTLILHGDNVIPSDGDLDNYTSTNDLGQYFAEAGNTIAHKPNNVNSFYMSSVRAGTYFYMEVLITSDEVASTVPVGSVFTRKYISNTSTWGAWIFMNDPASLEVPTPPVQYSSLEFEDPGFGTIESGGYNIIGNHCVVQMSIETSALWETTDEIIINNFPGYLTRSGETTSFACMSFGPSNVTLSIVYIDEYGDMYFTPASDIASSTTIFLWGTYICDPSSV